MLMSVGHDMAALSAAQLGEHWSAEQEAAGSNPSLAHTQDL